MSQSGEADWSVGWDGDGWVAGQQPGQPDFLRTLFPAPESLGLKATPLSVKYLVPTRYKGLDSLLV